ncbi:hypothetical protein [Aureimonas pseudogalii]|uniref:Uncharacterized protein n=1 Tax=Aureimonas pseudogalii TaxID=1744844 RepID=A0A7W6H7Q7_9HYPH|nr:hypothetical protein [Aureimonas pseudogalii]MBB4000052.1 hypothetical protein [Aureimonas pseudogalii]
MKILRFPLPPADRALRAGAAWIETGLPAARGSAGFGLAGLDPRGAHGFGQGLSDAEEEVRRLLWALTVLQRPSLERLVAHHPTARDVLAAFRSTVPFGADERHV